jgi:hypothetical protein
MGDDDGMLNVGPIILTPFISSIDNLYNKVIVYRVYITIALLLTMRCCCTTDR